MIRGSVKKRITVLMATLIVMVLGFFSLTKMRLSLLPDMDLPYMVVVTTYQGASAEEVNNEVTSKLESAIQTIDGYSSITSTSNEHYSMIFVEFEYGTNLESAQVELRESVNNIEFAEGVSNPMIMRISMDMMPVAVVSLSREYEGLNDEEEIIEVTNWVERDLMTRLESIAGVASVSMSGQSDTLLQITFDDAKLTQYGTSSEEILGIINEQNVSGLVGITFDAGSIRLLYLGDKVAMMDELKELPVLVRDGNVIELSDLTVDGGIKLVNNNSTSYSKTNGKQTVTLSFQMTSTANTVDVVKNIKEELKDIRGEYDNVSYRYTLDQSEYIETSVNSVLSNLIQGAFLAIIILFIFLKDYRPTLIVAISIPTSVIAAFVMMYFSGMSLNMISMGGLALAVGMLVDNSIVVIENMYRMLKEGASKVDAAIEGAKQVAGAIIASTITTMIVFVPLLFVEGLIGDVFIDLSYTVIFALLASLVVALTIVPSLGSTVLHEEKVKEDSKFIIKMKKAYRRVIEITLNHKWLTSGAIVFLLVASSVLSISRGFTMLPETDEGSISITLKTDGSNTFEEYSIYADELSEDILGIDKYIEVVSTTFSLGTDTTNLMSSILGTGGDSEISISVQLSADRKKSTDWYADKINKVIDTFDYTGFAVQKANILDVDTSAGSSLTSLMSSGISIKITGDDLYKMEEIATRVAEIVESVKGTEEVSNGVKSDSTNVKITVNKHAAMLHGLTQQDIVDNYSLATETMLSAYTTSGDTLYITIDGVEYEITVPASSSMAGVGLEILGDYKQFLSSFEIFDSETLAMMKEYVPNPAIQGDEIYYIDMVNAMPNLMTLGYIPFTFNPNLEVYEGRIVYDPTDTLYEGVKLITLSKGKVYSGNTSTSLAIVEEVSDFATIYTDGNTKYFTVTAKVKDGYISSNVSAEVTKAVEKYMNSAEFKAYGKGYKIIFAGENEEVMDTIYDLALALLIAIVLVYMVMAIQFQSLKYPFIIIGTIPLAFTGGLLALWISGMQVSSVALMGLLVLVGVVVNNGIVLIDYINQLRNEGKDLREAIYEAGQTRLRPIFMTALTTIFGLITLALGLQSGSELLQPMGVVVIGGLIYSTILTLVFVPVLYEAMTRKSKKA